MAYSRTPNYQKFAVQFPEGRVAEALTFTKPITLQSGAEVDGDVVLADALTVAGNATIAGTAGKLSFFGGTQAEQQAALVDVGQSGATDFDGTNQVNKAAILAAVQALQARVDELNAVFVAYNLLPLATP